MDHDEIIFIPKYPWRHRLALLTSPMLAGLGGWIAIVARPGDPIALLGLFFFLICTWIIWSHTYRKMCFGVSLVAKRYLLPPKVIAYRSIHRVGVGLIKSSQGSIVLFNCDNVGEFHAAVDVSKSRGYWNESQLDGGISRQRWIVIRSLSIAVTPALIAAAAVYPLEAKEDMIHWSVAFALTFMLVAVGAYVYYRRRTA